MTNKFITTTVFFLTIAGCKNSDSDCEYPVPLYHIQTDSAPADFNRNNLYEIIFVTEKTNNACYSYALDYIDEQFKKYDPENDDTCSLHTQIMVAYKRKVVETSSKLISEKNNLNIFEAGAFVNEYCTHNYSNATINAIDSFNVQGDKIHFTYSLDNQTYSGELLTQEMGLACPLYSISCHTYTVSNQETDK